jgi:glutaminyl-peptide cyclotransferase
MRFLIVAAACALAACTTSTQARSAPEYGYQIVHTYRHDPLAYTQGLVYVGNGILYEGTGLDEQSTIRKVKLDTGEVLQKRDVPGVFGEGIILWKGRLLELTWQHHIGFIYDSETFEPKGRFEYPGEGWGLTHDGKRIIMSDGTAQLRFWDPETLKETGRITVTDDGRPIEELNELEFIKGEVWANVYQTDRIARIDPATGKVTGWIDLSGILKAEDRNDLTDVLNGIAYDTAGDRIFVTGKRWPKLFEIRLTPKSGSK